MNSLIVVIALIVSLAATASSEDRVANAEQNQSKAISELKRRAGLDGRLLEVYIRAFKSERVVEFWARCQSNSKFVLVETYPIAAMSGELGPKRKEGDRQAPEGLYVIDRFNPKSSYHLSLGIDYPNASDRVLSDKSRPGKDIFIHGNQVSIGCLAMTDSKIEQIYLMAWEARQSGQRIIRVDIFPFRMNRSDPPEAPSLEIKELWNDLKPFFASFERSRIPPKFRVDNKGRYRTIKSPRSL